LTTLLASIIIIPIGIPFNSLGSDQKMDQKEYEEAKQRIQDNAGIPMIAGIGVIIIVY
jgi:hypothetical protein